MKASFGISMCQLEQKNLQSSSSSFPKFVTPSSSSFQKSAASNKRALELLPLLPQVTAIFDPFIATTKSASTDYLYLKHNTSTLCITIQHRLRRAQPELSLAQVITSTMHQNPLPFLDHTDKDSTISPQRHCLSLIPQLVDELHSSFRAAQSFGGPPMSLTSSTMPQP
ncbi:hypothetical protein CRG98_034368 [Punica granatum]|uniref:Uncharacterized protein n=1 Tax=Punica granatum TaxID=22663 RepID=A0A2I0IMJ8_PUNGR|nr:hypothetical protein CRG98_034368 [Punica granatum]